jgi:erythromycin esterase
VSVTNWLRENMHRLRTLDPDDDDSTDLEPLREIVGDARVVAIGESTHRVHEFYDLRHRVTRFLVRELGFTGFVLESGFPEGWAVHDWVLGGPGAVEDVTRDGITYHMGRCAEMREQLRWMRAYNAGHERGVRFYGMDVGDSAASARSAVLHVLRFLDDADPHYARRVRATLLPLFDHVPADRTPLAWAAPAIQAYLGTPAAVRHELTALIGELAERVAAMQPRYARGAGRSAAGIALRSAVTARHTDAFLAAFTTGPGRTYPGVSLRDLAMAENVGWILEREERVVVAGANGHVQRVPLHAPPILAEPLTMLGEYLDQALGERMVVIGTAIGGGTMWLRRQVVGAPLGHTEVFTEDVGPYDDPAALDALLSGAGVPLGLLDLRTVPDGPVARRFAELRGVMHGPHLVLGDPRAAFDAVVHIDRVSPWHTDIG